VGVSFWERVSGLDVRMLTIAFEFVGGPHDGKVVTGALGDAGDAERYYLFSNHGAVGQQFKVAADYAVEALAQERPDDLPRRFFQKHYYQVTGRLAEDDQVYIRAEYIAPVKKKA
jgi:hypothetical protein